MVERSDTTGLCATLKLASWKVIRPQGKMSDAAARQIMQLEFSDEKRARMHELAVKNQAGTLKPEESSELDNDTRRLDALRPTVTCPTGSENPSSRFLSHSWIENSLTSIGHAHKRPVNTARCRRPMTR